MLEDFLNKLAGAKGQVSLAGMAKVDPSTFNKFLAGTGAVKMHHLENLLSIGNAVIVDQEYLEGLENMIITMGEMLKKYKPR